MLFQHARTGAHREAEPSYRPIAAALRRGVRRAPRRPRWRWWTRITRATRRRSSGRSPSIARAQKEIDARAHERRQAGGTAGGEKGFNDTNYIFLSFVTRYLPAGIVGLVIAVIFAAAMSASSGEINSLATVTVVDIYQRHIKQRRAATIII